MICLLPLVYSAGKLEALAEVGQHEQVVEVRLNLSELTSK